MRGLVIVVLLTAIAVAVSERQKRWLWKKCGSDAECGAYGYCLKHVKVCGKKRIQKRARKLFKECTNVLDSFLGTQLRCASYAVAVWKKPYLKKLA